MPRKLVSLTLMIVDLLIVIMVSYLAYFVRFEGKLDSSYFQMLLPNLPVFIVIRLATFYLFGLYHRLWRYASISELLAIVGAVSISSLLIVFYMLTISDDLPRSIYIITWFLNILFIGASRLGVRVIAHLRQVPENGQTRVLVFGAGDAGAFIAREIQNNQYQTKKMIGFIDDDDFKQNKILSGFKVLGNREQLSQIVEKYQIDEIDIAIPSADANLLRQIILDCRKTGCRVKIVPSLDVLVNGKPIVEQLRGVNLEDLLGRPPVKLNTPQLANYLHGKKVLVTGAGGSIGSELCRQIVRFGPDSLYLLGKGENSIYEIDQELRMKLPDLHIVPIIADIRDKQRIDEIFACYGPEVVFHAAAHKHVPLMELQPAEAVKNNIFGTKNVAEAAKKYSTQVMIMISTDKAVNPTSVMGATKRVAEQIIQSMSKKSPTIFAAVRFGNVLGSRGSVVPLFKRQIEAGGPVTVTNPEMKRYFMTIPEAVQLVLQAGSMAKGGEVFVLDMGEPVKIYDLACTLIEQSGLRPHQDIEIKFTGMRPGEKLYEEILTAEEGTTATEHEQIYVANLQTVDDKLLNYGLIMLQQTYAEKTVRQLLYQLIPAFSGTKQLVPSSFELNQEELAQLAAMRE